MKNNVNTKEKFIETSYKLFQVKGYNATGLNEILKESGAPKGSLYYHFPRGKEELALESVKLAGERIIENLLKTLNIYEDPIEGIVSNLNKMAAMVDNDKKMQDMSISLIALETYNSSEILRSACEEVFSAIENIYAERLIKHGIKEEKAKEIAITILAMTEGAINLSLTRKSGEALRIIGKQISLLIKE
ncbi:TetR/AcrR family transcriptional regulator [Clostridium perfringens]|nr:TetR/AcrR family transcriptional regulator [Clostridium perfringens]MDZ4992336.1 TetR family transcriptional regulator [Clostridium perfringens]